MYFSPTFLTLLHQKISQNRKNHIYFDKNNHKNNQEISHLSSYFIKGTSINSTFKYTFIMIIKTFACFMFFIGIFSSFFQSHSSLCSF